jgi:lantibiotic transport system permease protein
MWRRTLQAELLKLRRSPVWLAFVFVPIIPAFIGTFNYVQNIEILESEWYSLWTQHTLFACYFFLPAIIAVYCSYLMRLEHSNHNWNSVMTMPVPAVYIFLAKLLIVSFLLVLTQLWVGLLFVISGLMAGIKSPLPPELVIWLITGLIGGIVICTLQLFLSLVIRSFAMPVAIAFTGSVAGIAVFAKGLSAWYPYTLYSTGMRANNPTGAMACSMEQFLINCILFSILFSFMAILWMEKRDVADS